MVYPREILINKNVQVFYGNFRLEANMMIFFSSSNMESFGWFLTLHQELRFFLSLVWQEQIYIDKRKKVGAIWNKIGNHWFFNISVAKISMFLPSLFFCSQRFQHFFKFLPRQKGKRKFSRIITLKQDILIQMIVNSWKSYILEANQEINMEAIFAVMRTT